MKKWVFKRLTLGVKGIFIIKYR